MQREHRYPHNNMTRVIIETNGTHQLDIDFDVADVTNQPGWTADAAGVAQAKSDINTWIASCNDSSGSVTGLATEATQQAILTAVQLQQDFEIKLVVDEGNGDKVVCQVTEYDEQTGLYSYSYTDVNGVAYVPTGPLNYINPDAMLALILAELVDSPTVNTVVSTALAGATPAGVKRGSVLNVGSQPGTWNGVIIPAGVGLPFGGTGKNNTTGIIAYDPTLGGTGTTFLIEYDI